MPWCSKRCKEFGCAMVQQTVQGIWLCHGAANGAANGARNLVVPWCSKWCKEFGCAVVQQTVQGVWLCHGAANGAIDGQMLGGTIHTYPLLVFTVYNVDDNHPSLLGNYAFVPRCF